MGHAHCIRVRKYSLVTPGRRVPNSVLLSHLSMYMLIEEVSVSVSPYTVHVY